jgi:hypothetical protein
MTEQILIELTRLSMTDQVVASRPLDDGINLLVYPLLNGIVVGLGYARDQQRRLALPQLLQRRSQALPRYGAWLPALLTDGSLYVVRKISGVDPAQQHAALSAEMLQSGRELLA